jgi:hypothetical protein
MVDQRANTRTNHLRDRYREQQAALRAFQRAQRHLTAAHEARIEAEQAEKAAADQQAAALAALARLVGDDQVTAAATDLDPAEVATARKHTQPTGSTTTPPARQSTRRTAASRSRVTSPTTTRRTRTGWNTAPVDTRG